MSAAPGGLLQATSCCWGPRQSLLAAPITRGGIPSLTYALTGTRLVQEGVAGCWLITAKFLADKLSQTHRRTSAANLVGHCRRLPDGSPRWGSQAWLRLGLRFARGWRCGLKCRPLASGKQCQVLIASGRNSVSWPFPTFSFTLVQNYWNTGGLRQPCFRAASESPVSLR